MSYLKRHLVIQGNFKGHKVSVARATSREGYIIYVGRKAMLTCLDLPRGLKKIFTTLSKINKRVK